jgi:hypothetical protein
MKTAEVDINSVRDTRKWGYRGLLQEVSSLLERKKKQFSSGRGITVIYVVKLL